MNAGERAPDPGARARRGERAQVARGLAADQADVVLIVSVLGLIFIRLAGALALLGAVLGTVAAVLASLAFAHSSITTTFADVPWADLGLLVIGMPLIAAAAGWLLGGREPAGVARQPME